MESEIEHRVLGLELSILADELLKRLARRELEGDAERIRFVKAQVVLCGVIMECYLGGGNSEEPYVDTTYDDLCEELELQHSLYREARVTNERDAILITLARMRAIKTLLRRLENPIRRALLHDDGRPYLLH